MPLIAASFVRPFCMRTRRGAQTGYSGSPWPVWASLPGFRWIREIGDHRLPEAIHLEMPVLPSLVHVSMHVVELDLARNSGQDRDAGAFLTALSGGPGQDSARARDRVRYAMFEFARCTKVDLGCVVMEYVSRLPETKVVFKGASVAKPARSRPCERYRPRLGDLQLPRSRCRRILSGPGEGLSLARGSGSCALF